jgi:tRNA uridine 5-carboxymethylaminomethyl modification enzyme
MFTSRAEYRLLLREDNADLRLREKGYAVGLVHEGDYRKFIEKRDMIIAELERLRVKRLVPSETDPAFMEEYCLLDLQNALSYEQLLRRPELTYRDLEKIDVTCRTLPGAVREQVEIQIKYQGYIDRQLQQIERSSKLEASRIPENFDYVTLTGLSAEVREKLIKFRPDTLGQASRIQGVTPVAVSILAVALKAGRGK